MNTLDQQAVYILDHEAIPPDHSEAVLDAAFAARSETACIELEGSGAVACVQGLTTNDINGAGDGSFQYGAFLTPKGMILSDVWIARFDDAVTLFLPSGARDDIVELLQRSVPPRMARVSDISHDTAIFRLTGPLSLENASLAGFSVPDPGRCILCKIGPSEYLVSRPPDPAPFALQIRAKALDIHDVNLSLTEGNVVVGKNESLEIPRVIAGWPKLGAEIDLKTLPQEVRFDELGGVSYTKGCYTGQEVVARLHFRGHANKSLIGLSWEKDPDYRGRRIMQGETEVGRVTSMIWLDPIDQYIGIGMIKHSANMEKPVLAARSEATLVKLPFRFDS